MAKSIVIFDTEFTTWPGTNERRWTAPGEFRELVQVGAIRWQKGQPWQQAPTFDMLAKPVLNPNLSEYFVNLTGITQAQLEAEGHPTQKVLADFAAFQKGAMAWSNGGDMKVLAETAGLQGIPLGVNPRHFASLHIALQAALKAEVGEYNLAEYPSGRVYELLGLTLPTTQVHNALHDVYSLAATIEELERRGHDIGLWDEGEDITPLR